jgi:hypothetical protein
MLPGGTYAGALFEQGEAATRTTGPGHLGLMMAETLPAETSAEQASGLANVHNISQGENR